MSSPARHSDELPLADRHLAAGRLGEAAEAYRRVLVAAPDHPAALHGLAWVEHHRGDTPAAVALLRRAVASDPTNPGLWNNLGILQASLRQLDAAAECYARAVAICPTFAEAHLNSGNAMRDRRRWPDAVAAYAAAVRHRPDFAAAHHALATALREVGRVDEAVAHYRRAAELDPASAAPVENDLGLTFARRGDAARAESHFRRAVALRPDYAKPYRNLGGLLLRAARPADAAAVLAKWAAMEPQSPEAHQQLGVALGQSGRPHEAVAHFRRAVELRPDDAAANCNLGVALEETGDVAGAAAAFGAALRLRPDSPVIAYHHAALSGAAPPATCPPAYVVDLFDRYADRFEDHLVTTLNYRAPQFLRDAVAAVSDRTGLSVMDLGCGTGLCGELFRPLAAHLVGVDLSPRMIEHSRRRGAYDRLIQSDAVDALRQYPRSLDLVLSADVFIYVGDLEAVFAATAAALRPGGLFAFTVEVVPDAAGDFVLRATRRYAQSHAYLRSLAARHGLEELSAEPVTLREGERGGVPGLVVVMRVAANANGPG